MYTKSPWLHLYMKVDHVHHDIYVYNQFKYINETTLQEQKLAGTITLYSKLKFLTLY